MSVSLFPPTVPFTKNNLAEAREQYKKSNNVNALNFLKTD